MSIYKNVIETARRENADFVAYKNGPGKSVCIIDVATEEVIANASPLGAEIFAAGVAARKGSFLDYDTGLFSCGTYEQVAGGAFPIGDSKGE